MAMTETQAARWEQRVKRGKAIFVVQTALSFFLVVIAVTRLAAFQFPQILLSWAGTLFVLLLSVLVGFVIWRFKNSRYESYLLDQKNAIR